MKLKERMERAQSSPTSLSTLATLYNCCGLFDMCSDADLMSLTLEGSSDFLDWVGWERTNVCKIVRNFIDWVRPEEALEGGRSVGYLADPCGDANGVEFGTCTFSLEDFARLRRVTPTRDITKSSVRYCEAQPRYRLDGSPINDDREFGMLMATEVILQDLKGMIMDGNATTPGQFDGFKRLVKTGYTCKTMDSIIVDWNDNPLSGGAGITWNGNAVGATYNFIDVLLAIYRRLAQRKSFSPTLAARRLMVGDMVLVLPSSFVQCVLDQYTCWSVCPGAEFNEANLNTFEARRFRDSLLGGLFGAGRIYLDGFEIPILPFDWGTVVGPTRFDAWLLTGSIGGQRLIQGQYNDMTPTASARPDRFAATDGGRLLSWSNDDNTCESWNVEMQPRLLLPAPWMQARIQDIRCNTVAGVLVGDPFEGSFFPETSFNPATCPS